ncbi:MAG: TrkH family potassium uptake protein [Gemmatimonadetes bacterium]|nr:TrkH family potassium uptake protein [Gemmatimonadota bacterium]MBT7862647.1 TrkH family potassium uptake protein [Gemmatimonadota bacterium]
MNRDVHPVERNAAIVAHVLGALLLVTAAGMLPPIICSLVYGEDDLFALAVAAATSGAIGGLLYWRFRRHQSLHPRHAFLIASAGWVIVSAVSALPFMIHGSIPSFTDAFFEMMSGYTTSGSTILTDIEVVPHGLLFWRSETHLIGGMGFVTLAVFLLPHGMEGLRLFRAESSPGQVITKERFTERNRDAMIVLWTIYLVLNSSQVLLLLAGGMSLFDSLCHTFATVSTSGFSPYNASMGYFDNAYFDWVVIIFMFLGGVSFVLFYFLARGEWRSFKINTEFRWYVGFVLFFCVAVSLILWEHGTYGLADSVRFGTFQVVSLLTTTGFTTADYELWPGAAQVFLYVVCFIGACAGSTTSGIKVVHFVIICKFMVAAMRKIYFRPLAVVAVRLNGRRIELSVIHLALCYFIVNIFLILAGACFMAVVEGMDLLSATTSVIATLMNIGPGWGSVGPSENFAHISDVGKWFLSFMMLVGRLEMFTPLVLFYPSFWKH